MRVKAGLIAAVAGFTVFASTAVASSPSATGVATPATVAPGRSTLLTVAVTPGADPVSTGVFVSCNLSSIGADFSQMLVDDGTSGDAHASDLVFSYRATVSPTAALGARSLPCVVSDAQGRSTLPQIALNVDAVPNQPPTADAGGPYQVDEGSTVPLAATGSDPEGGALTFAWDLNGDGVFETPGEDVSFAPDDGPATRAVSAQVTDDAGQATGAVATVTVANVAPTASFDAPASAAGPFRLSLVSADDPSLADIAAGFTYAFDCGDGYGTYGSSASATCSAPRGIVSVGARIRDKDGGLSEYRGVVSELAGSHRRCVHVGRLPHKGSASKARCRTHHKKRPKNAKATHAPKRGRKGLRH